MWRYPLGGLVVLVVVAAAFGLLATADTATPGPSDEEQHTVGRSPPPQIQGGGGTVIPVDVRLIFGGLLVALLGVVGYLFVTAGRGVTLDDDSMPERDGADLDAVAQAAGRAADRIAAEGNPSNEVYRAWQAMTRHLDVPNPGATTPDEFADSAVDAGMDPDDVRDLTRLFEEVRYGGHSPAGRERRALEILRRIETGYAPDTGDADSSGERTREGQTDVDGMARNQEWEAPDG